MIVFRIAETVVYRHLLSGVTKGSRNGQLLSPDAVVEGAQNSLTKIFYD